MPDLIPFDPIQTYDFMIYSIMLGVDTNYDGSLSLMEAYDGFLNYYDHFNPAYRNFAYALYDVVATMVDSDYQWVVDPNYDWQMSYMGYGNELEQLAGHAGHWLYLDFEDFYV